MADVICENLFKRYGKDVYAVRDLTLHVHSGELLALVGPSGCGKTTTLRLIAGLEQPDDGLVRIDGRNVNHVPPRDRNVAMVFQDHSLYPHMTVRQNMAFSLKMQGVGRAEREARVLAAAQTLGIADLLHRKPGQLSGGQRQRAALGRALVRRPQCFLLDEPLSNLEPSARVALREQIRVLHAQLNATVIHVTHDQEEAMTLGDRIAVMHDGAIVQVGPPMQLYHKPVNRFVAGFIGSPMMNFIEGRIEREGLGLIFTDGRSLRFPVPAASTLQVQYHAGRPVIAGIRPGQLMLASNADDRAAPLWMRVARIDCLGEQLLVHGSDDAGQALTAALPGRNEIQPGQHLTLCVDPDHVHYFEPGETGRHLVYGASDSAVYE